MTDQIRIGASGELEIERTWDGEPLWHPETVQEGLFAGDAFEQMRGQLAIEDRQTCWCDGLPGRCSACIAGDHR